MKYPLSKWFILSCLLCSSIPSFAQSEVEKEADKILNQVIQSLKSLSSLQVSFTINVHDANDKKLGTQQGVVKLKKTKYELQMGDQQIFSDGKTVWVYNKILNEVQVDNYVAKKGSLFDVENIFSGSLNTKEFKSKVNATKNIDGVSCKEVELTPINKNNLFFKALLWINPQTSQIIEAKIFDKRGTRFIYQTQKFIKNPNFSNDFGSFKASNFKGVEVVDLR